MQRDRRRLQRVDAPPPTLRAAEIVGRGLVRIVHRDVKPENLVELLRAAIVRLNLALEVLEGGRLRHA